MILFTVIISFFSWGSVDKAINSSASGEWMLPIIFFSIFFILLYLVAILIKENYILQLLPLFCFFLSFLFVINFWHFAAILLDFAFVIIGIYRIRRDINLNIKVNLGKTITTGKQFIIIAVAIVVSSQYFLTIKDKDFQYVIPQVQSSKLFDTLTSNVLGMINPDFKNISNENTTVDEFIIETQKNQLESGNLSDLTQDQVDKTIEDKFGDTISSEQKESLRQEAENRLSDANSKIIENNQEVLLTESRKSLSQLVGKDLTGQEKVSEIFPEMINKKITDYFKPKMGEKSSLPFLPIVLAILLFLTIIPLGSILNIFWTLIVRLIFWILVKSRVVTVSKVQKEVEVIE